MARRTVTVNDLPDGHVVLDIGRQDPIYLNANAGPRFGLVWGLPRHAMAGG